MSQKPRPDQAPKPNRPTNDQLGQNGPPPVTRAEVERYGKHGSAPAKTHIAPSNQARPTSPQPPPASK
jgi:hypothetical protein